MFWEKTVLNTLLLFVVLFSAVDSKLIDADSLTIDTRSIQIQDSTTDSSVTESNALVPDSTKQTLPDTLDDSSATVADTIRDSSEIESERLRLLQRLKTQSRYLYTHPTTADTLFNPYEINRIAFSRDDYFTWNEVLRAQGEFTPIYFSPRHYYNRPLWRGYTLPLQQQRNSLLSGAATISNIFPNYEPLQVKKLYLTASGDLKAELFPETWVSPQVYFTMENGLFDGNTLELRVMRNITRNISMGLFSSFRNLNRIDYTQDHAGGMYDLYYGMDFVDTANLAKDGVNPLSQNHLTTIHLQWKKRNTFNLRYSYQDLSNDMVYPYYPDSPASRDSTNSEYDTVWYNRNDYNSNFNVSGSVPVAEKLSWNFEGEFFKTARREKPITTNILKSSDQIKGDQKYMGAGTNIQFAPIENDTVTLTVSGSRTETIHTNSVKTSTIHTDIYGSNKYTTPSGVFAANGDAGVKILHTNGKSTIFPYFNGLVKFEPSFFSVEGWGKMDMLPLHIPFDSTLIPLANEEGDAYWGAGIRSHIASNHLALSLGYSHFGGIRENSINAYWDNVNAPYENPNHVLTVTPSFGEWKGISLSSSWSLSDTKPYLKSTSRIDFHINKENRTRHFYTTFYVNYWSARDKFEYAGRDNWHRPVYDVGTKLTAEIKSFRLFMKIDNLLNRNNSYVPGYYMPGVIIRWGFSWTITG